MSFDSREALHNFAGADPELAEMAGVAGPADRRSKLGVDNVDKAVGNMRRAAQRAELRDHEGAGTVYQMQEYRNTAPAAANAAIAGAEQHQARYEEGIVNARRQVAESAPTGREQYDISGNPVEATEETDTRFIDESGQGSNEEYVANVFDITTGQQVTEEELAKMSVDQIQNNIVRGNLQLVEDYETSKLRPADQQFEERAA